MDAVALQSLVAELGGRCNGPRVMVTGVGIDSRSLVKGDLFVALPGDQADGHDFVSAAAAAGASAVMVSREVDTDLPQWVVEDTRRSLVELACWIRSQSQALTVGITGSNGKTTVKEMVSAILQEVGPTHASKGNFNNELGVPLTLCGLNAEHQYAVVEMGCARPGDISLLASWVRPRVGLVNNVGPAHLAGFGSVSAIAAGKGELFEALPAEGCAVINADDPFASFWEQQAAHCHILRFSLEGLPADVVGSISENNQLQIQLPEHPQSFEVRVPLPGRHNQLNALAATSVAAAMDIPVDAIVRGIENVAAVAGRLVATPGIAGSELIDDTYNANPASLTAAMQTVSTQYDGPVWLVLGDMAELGPEAEALHTAAGREARALGFKRLYALGPLSAHAAEAFGENAACFDDHDALIKVLTDALGKGVRVLVKGSRSSRMERVVMALSDSADAGGQSC
ncbi:MAG: UDP-N-acetylmuramoyl-tripeptide--D-alanyl-D-alanine ligase [Gammaproteobacteria bacterium]|nr:UDP-N-acetylmuramoyl-tripeptide--D-alanyl-D-alanine ligase [Gammaproteobacteria bacterium]